MVAASSYEDVQTVAETCLSFPASAGYILEVRIFAITSYVVFPEIAQSFGTPRTSSSPAAWLIPVTSSVWRTCPACTGSVKSGVSVCEKGDIKIKKFIVVGLFFIGRVAMSVFSQLLLDIAWRCS